VSEKVKDEKWKIVESHQVIF